MLSPRRKKDFGLTDGEMLERLWAYIRGFGKMTKEMRPSHRIDVLTDALLHYGKRTSDKIGTFKNVCGGHACMLVWTNYFIDRCLEVFAV